MRFLLGFVLGLTVFISGFSMGYFGSIFSINEMRVQECLILEKKLHQYVYLHLDLNTPISKRTVQFPDTLDDLGPVYGKIFGFSYEIDKAKFLYEPLMNHQQYVLEVGMAYGKKYISPRSR